MKAELLVGQRIKERRLVLKLTQDDLSKTLGVTRQHISFIEQGKGSPSLTLLPKLASELGVSVDYLVSGKTCVITDSVPAVKADKLLSLKSKKAIIALIEELQREGSG